MMNQKQFNAKFTKQAFVKFLQSLKGAKLKAVDVGSGENCFFSKFAKKAFATNKVFVGWSTIEVGEGSFTYPAWATCYLSRLQSMMDVHSTTFATVARDASVHWLAD